MASISSKLSTKDKEALALFYETDAYSSLTKLLKLTKDNTAGKSINALDFHQVKWLQGQYVAIELLEKELETIHAWSQKR